MLIPPVVVDKLNMEFELTVAVIAFDPFSMSIPYKVLPVVEVVLAKAFTELPLTDKLEAVPANIAVIIPVPECVKLVTVLLLILIVLELAVVPL